MKKGDFKLNTGIIY